MRARISTIFGTKIKRTITRDKYIIYERPCVLKQLSKQCHPIVMGCVVVKQWFQEILCIIIKRRTTCWKKVWVNSAQFTESGGDGESPHFFIIIKNTVFLSMSVAYSVITHNNTDGADHSLTKWSARTSQCHRNDFLNPFGCSDYLFLNLLSSFYDEKIFKKKTQQPVAVIFMLRTIKCNRSTGFFFEILFEIKKSI